jgi:ABC-2 type transport system permease protein
MGSAWLTDPIITIAYVALNASILVGILVPDAFAGERERRTLATLLASPLSNWAIFVAKLSVPVLVNSGVTIGSLAVSVVIANLAESDGVVRLFPPALMLGLPLLSLLLGLLVGSLGILISLRSATVQGAQQVLISALMGPLVVIGILFMTIATGGGPPPDWLANPDLGAVMLALCAVTAAIEVPLLVAVAVRFNRSRLIALG